MQRIQATRAYFIKLGRGSEWEAECLTEGFLRFGYHATPHELCLQGKWDDIWKLWKKTRGDEGAATRDKNQIRAFYEADESCIFVTFANSLLHWCHPTGDVEVLPDESRKRRTVDGWHHTSVNGTELTSDRISGGLLKVQMYQGTICQIKLFDYLLRKLNDEVSLEVRAVEEAERQLLEALVGLMRFLSWKDFELLVDLVFATSGWRRLGSTGGSQKTVDIELLLPTTNERALVQVKSQADQGALNNYISLFREATVYQRMFFVWHSGTLAENQTCENVTLIGPSQLSRLVVEAGLSSWVREKVM